MSHSCCAIVVSYNPEVSVLLSLLRRISNSGCDFLLIDNDSANFDEFGGAVSSLSGCIGIDKRSENQGLASAMNIGLRQLLTRPYRFALLFDQDSCIGSSFCHDLLAAYQEALETTGERVAAIGPRLQNPHTGRRTPFKRFNRLFYRSDTRLDSASSLYHADFLISSGTLLVLEALPDIGLMKDDYFIDNVDLEWCFRARAKGYALYGTDKAVLFHMIGEDSRNPLVRAGLVVQHSPLRCYYSTRNRINLYRKSYAPTDWKVRDFCRFVLKSAGLLIFSRSRGQYWASIRKGIVDSKALS